MSHLLYYMMCTLFSYLKSDVEVFSCFIFSVLPIPIVVITGGVRHKDYLIRYSYNESHQHYNEFKA